MMTEKNKPQKSEYMLENIFPAVFVAMSTSPMLDNVIAASTKESSQVNRER